MLKGFEHIRHIVVLMPENRSFHHHQHVADFFETYRERRVHKNA